MLQEDAAHDDTLDGSLTMIDGSSIRAHQHAAGAKKVGADPALGRSRGGWGSKLHLITERAGKPIVATVTAGQRYESPQVIPLEQATERLWPEAVAGDKGYSASDLQNWLQAPEIEVVIPYREDEMGDPTYDREAYRERPIIERAINRLKRYRRIAMRYEKLADSYLAMLTIAMILEWI